MTLRCYLASKYAKLPTKAYEDALGFDLYSEMSATLLPHSVTLVSTGLQVEFPIINDIKYGGIIKDRSSMAKKGVFVTGGVIDYDYRGLIFVALYNSNYEPHTIQMGEKFAQMILVAQPTVEVEHIIDPPQPTLRGHSGFGSSGTF